MTDNDVKRLIEASRLAGSFSNIDDLTDCIWYEEEDNRGVHWNGEDSVEDLLNGDGDTYYLGAYIRYETPSYVVYKDSYLLTGDRATQIFSKDKQIDYDSY